MIASPGGFSRDPHYQLPPPRATLCSLVVFLVLFCACPLKVFPFGRTPSPLASFFAAASYALLVIIIVGVAGLSAPRLRARSPGRGTGRTVALRASGITLFSISVVGILVTLASIIPLAFFAGGGSVFPSSLARWSLRKQLRSQRALRSPPCRQCSRRHAGDTFADEVAQRQPSDRSCVVPGQLHGQ